VTANEDRGTVQRLVLATAIEWLLIALVLHITLGMSGLSGTHGRTVAIAAIVALASGSIGYFLQTGFLDPIRMGFSFLILVLLLNALFRIQSWSVVLRTALLVRFISLGLTWLCYSTANTLLGF